MIMMEHSEFQAFGTLDEFYEQRGGKDSMEVDFGINHWDDLAPELGPWNRHCLARVSYVTETGDFYAIQGWGDSRRVLLLGSVPRRVQQDVIDKFFDRREIALPEGKPLSWFASNIRLVNDLDNG